MKIRWQRHQLRISRKVTMKMLEFAWISKHAKLKKKIKKREKGKEAKIAKNENVGIQVKKKNHEKRDYIKHFN